MSAYTKVILPLTTISESTVTEEVSAALPCPSAFLMLNVTSLGNPVAPSESALYLQAHEPALGEWFDLLRLDDIASSGIKTYEIGPALKIDLLLPARWRLLLAPSGPMSLAASVTMYPQ